jgi:hypothetical protein
MLYNMNVQQKLEHDYRVDNFALEIKTMDDLNQIIYISGNGKILTFVNSGGYMSEGGENGFLLYKRLIEKKYLEFTGICGILQG